MCTARTCCCNLSAWYVYLRIRKAFFLLHRYNTPEGKKQKLLFTLHSFSIYQGFWYSRILYSTVCSHTCFFFIFFSFSFIYILWFTASQHVTGLKNPPKLSKTQKKFNPGFIPSLHSPFSVGGRQRDADRSRRETGTGSGMGQCRKHLLDRCPWPHCNCSCPRCRWPDTMNEVNQYFMKSLASVMDIDPNKMENVQLCGY